MDYFSEFEGKKWKMRGKTKYTILTIGIDVTQRGNRLFSVNSSNRNAGGSKCQLLSFIKASAPPASASINLDNSTTHNRTLWRIMWWRRVIPGSLLFSFRHHLVLVLTRNQFGLWRFLACSKKLLLKTVLVWCLHHTCNVWCMPLSFLCLLYLAGHQYGSSHVKLVLCKVLLKGYISCLLPVQGSGSESILNITANIFLIMGT